MILKFVKVVEFNIIIYKENKNIYFVLNLNNKIRNIIQKYKEEKDFIYYKLILNICYWIFLNFCDLRYFIKKYYNIWIINFYKLIGFIY